MIIYTALKARLRRIKFNSDKPYNWLFLPGGPGLGSESLSPIANMLDLPGSVWLLDLPNDGSNLVSDDDYLFESWSAALAEAIQSLDKVILVAHSTGGMYALATPELKDLLYGFVIMDSAPNASWQDDFIAYVNNHPLPDVQRLQKIFADQPNNQNLKQLTIASIPYLRSHKEPIRDFSFFEHLFYNARACQWSSTHFDQTYQAQWVPTTIPTLIFAGEDDHITPLDIFRRAAEFNHENIVMRIIKHAGHYPWIENKDEVKLIFKEYCHRLT